MDRNMIFEELRKRNESVPIPLTLPSKEEVKEIESRLKVILPNDFKEYLLNISDVVFGTIEPVNATDPNYYTFIDIVFKNFSALSSNLSINKQLYPICEDNSNFYCMDETGIIIYISHDGVIDAPGMSLEEWIENVWLESA